MAQNRIGHLFWWRVKLSLNNFILFKQSFFALFSRWLWILRLSSLFNLFNLLRIQRKGVWFWLWRAFANINPQFLLHFVQNLWRSWTTIPVEGPRFRLLFLVAFFIIFFFIILYVNLFLDLEITMLFCYFFIFLWVLLPLWYRKLLENTQCSIFFYFELLLHRLISLCFVPKVDDSNFHCLSCLWNFIKMKIWVIRQVYVEMEILYF